MAGEQRELIGAVVDLTDGANTFSQYLAFPSGDTLTQFSLKFPKQENTMHQFG